MWSPIHDLMITSDFSLSSFCILPFPGSKTKMMPICSRQATQATQATSHGAMAQPSQGVKSPCWLEAPNIQAMDRIHSCNATDLQLL